MQGADKGVELLSKLHEITIESMWYKAQGTTSERQLPELLKSAAKVASELAWSIDAEEKERAAKLEAKALLEPALGLFMRVRGRSDEKVNRADLNFAGALLQTMTHTTWMSFQPHLLAKMPLCEALATVSADVVADEATMGIVAQGDIGFIRKAQRSFLDQLW
jgi:hypothetical protein